MKWQIDLSKDADKFLRKNKIADSMIVGEIKNALRKLQGADLNVDVKKMKGAWKGFFRLRVGRIRILIKIDFDNRKVFIDRIDFRGNVYK